MHQIKKNNLWLESEISKKKSEMHILSFLQKSDWKCVLLDISTMKIKNLDFRFHH